MGVVLDEELTFQDKGVSGFTGANLETGELGVFLERVKDGTIPRGSWLLVENLDRISRQSPRKAMRVIEDIVGAGVTVVDLSDGGREYSAENLDRDHFLLIMMVMKFIRANEESVTKGARVAKAHAARDRITVRREQVQPIPDIQLQGAAGYSFETRNAIATAQAGIELPVFNRNQGTIQEARADLARSQAEVARVELSLRERVVVW